MRISFRGSITISTVITEVSEKFFFFFFLKKIGGHTVCQGKMATEGLVSRSTRSIPYLILKSYHQVREQRIENLPGKTKERVHRH